MSFHVSREPFEKLRPSWDSILSSSRNDSLYLSEIWISSWLENIKDFGEEYFITVRKGKELFGIAPLVLVKRKFFCSEFQIVGQKYSYELGFIARKDYEKEVYGLLFQFIFTKMKEGRYILNFSHMKNDQYFETELNYVLKHSRMSVVRDLKEPVFQLSLPGSFESYISESISSGLFRRNLRKDIRIALRKKNIFFLTPTVSEVRFFLDTLFKLHLNDFACREKYSYLFQEAVRKHYFQVAHEYSKKEDLKFALMKSDDESTTSIMMGVNYKKTFHAIIMGIDRNIRKRSEGINFRNVLHAISLKNVIETGIERYELGAYGLYKFKLGAVEVGGHALKIFCSEVHLKWVKLLERIRRLV
ncbi:MAG: GNAT family N-acetyltransferase [Candidatus Riflebacteria bacterium]|nr:GNAT family N-acetyltransferase [Candidatus Riflebacteria bacterium]